MLCPRIYRSTKYTYIMNDIIQPRRLKQIRAISKDLDPAYPRAENLQVIYYITIVTDVPRDDLTVNDSGFLILTKTVNIPSPFPEYCIAVGGRFGFTAYIVDY